VRRHGDRAPRRSGPSAADRSPRRSRRRAPSPRSST
jgi:hypothetical protein